MERAGQSSAEQYDSQIRDVWVNGARSFFSKGTSGRWKAVLSEEELAMYEHAAAKALTPACRTWLEQGRAGASISPTSPTRRASGQKEALTHVDV